MIKWKIESTVAKNIERRMHGNRMRLSDCPIFIWMQYFRNGISEENLQFSLTQRDEIPKSVVNREKYCHGKYRTHE